MISSVSKSAKKFFQSLLCFHLWKLGGSNNYLVDYLMRKKEKLMDIDRP